MFEKRYGLGLTTWRCCFAERGNRPGARLQVYTLFAHVIRGTAGRAQRRATTALDNCTSLARTLPCCFATAVSWQPPWPEATINGFLGSWRSVGS